VLEQAQRLGDVVGVGWANDGRGDARVADGELEGGGGQGHVEVLADLRDLAGAGQDVGRRGLVGVAGVRLGAASEQAAAVRGGVEDGQAAPRGEVDQWPGGAVEQRVAVVGDDGLEGAGLDVADQHVDRAARDAEVLDDALVAQVLQDLEGAAGGHDLLEGGVLGVVQVDDLQALQAEQAEAALDGAFDLLAGEVAGLEVAVGLGGQDQVVGESAQLTQDEADAALALAVAVRGGGVEEVDRAVGDGLQGGQGLVLGHGLGVGVGHVAQGGGAEADRRDLQVGLAERAQRQAAGAGAHGRASVRPGVVMCA
jgi:hypothetical protein